MREPITPVPCRWIYTTTTALFYTTSHTPSYPLWLWVLGHLPKLGLQPLLPRVLGGGGIGLDGLGVDAGQPVGRVRVRRPLAELGLDPVGPRLGLVGGLLLADAHLHAVVPVAQVLDVEVAVALDQRLAIQQVVDTEGGRAAGVAL